MIENISDNYILLEANEIFDDQNASLQQISSSLQELNLTAQVLENLAKKL